MQIFRLLKANHSNLENYYGEKSVEFYRAVFLSTLGRSFAAMLVAIHVVVLFPGTSFIETDVKLMLAPFIGVLVGMLVFSAWLVENGHDFYSRALTNFTVSMSTMLSIIFCGGFLESHATPFLIAPIVVCFCISPRTEAIAVGTFTFLAPLVIDIVVRSMGIELPNYTSTSSPIANELFLVGTLFITVVIALAYLQKTNEELHLALNHDKHLFEKWASIDFLTEIGNRRHFEMQLDDAIATASESGEELAILYIDLNGFKTINDQFGHEAGDRVLKTTASRLAEAKRDCDYIARLGGDEFAVLLSAPADLSVVISQTARLRAAVEKPVQFGGQNHDIFASIGQASYPKDGTNLSDLIRAADLDMYAHKMRMRLSDAHSQLSKTNAV